MSTLEKEIATKGAEAINEKFANDPSMTVTATVEDAPTEEETKQSAEARHYAEILSATAEVQDALYEYEQAKDLSSSLKKDYERLNERLIRLISHGPDRQKKLFKEPDTSEQPSDAYRSHLVSELALTKGLVEGLENLGLTTLGELQDYWRAGKHLYDEKGWGQEKAAKVADAYADFGVKHPELFGKVDSRIHDASGKPLTTEEFAAAVDKKLDEQAG